MCQEYQEKCQLLSDLKSNQMCEFIKNKDVRS
jgi:hypothetical protein